MEIKLICDRALRQMRAMGYHGNAQDYRDSAKVVSIGAIGAIKDPNDLWDIMEKLCTALEGAADTIDEAATLIEKL